MSDFVEQYIECLEGSGFWRLFVDGYRQRASFASQNSLGEFQEFHLGHFLWATREPTGLNTLRESAKRLLKDESCCEIKKIIENIYNNIRIAFKKVKEC